ncbi:MAG: Crp/Fnr family transcriptional regulator [Clostridiales bacterium]|nr:Crp/Fnr family transcriptional regulator [Clostridiales bacterium]
METEYLRDMQGAALFRGIAPEDLQALTDCFCPLVKRYQKGEIAVNVADPLRGVGIVLRGEIEIAHENAAGSKSLLAVIGQGQTFGEVAAFAGQNNWPATVTARCDCVLMFVPPERFLGNCPRACGFHKTLIQNMLRILSEKALRLNRKVEYLEIKGIRQKLCTYLLEQRRINRSDTFILPMNKSELADYLSVSRPSMSRELGLLRDQGVLDFYLSSVRLLDVEAVKKTASS